MKHFTTSAKTHALRAVISASVICLTACSNLDTTADDTVASGQSSTTTVSQTTTSEPGPTWILKNSFDAFSAPWAQAVCDTLNDWKPPAESTASEVADFTELVTDLKDLMGSPGDPGYSDTYLEILAVADAALEYEKKYPDDTFNSFTVSQGYHRTFCEALNLTAANSKYAAKPE